MTVLVDKNFLVSAIKREIGAELHGLMNEAIQEAQIKVNQEMRAKVDKIALKVLQHYSMIENNTQLVISVSKEGLK